MKLYTIRRKADGYFYRLDYSKWYHPNHLPIQIFTFDKLWVDVEYEALLYEYSPGEIELVEYELAETVEE